MFLSVFLFLTNCRKFFFFFSIFFLKFVCTRSTKEFFKNFFKRVRAFQIELESGGVG